MATMSSKGPSEVTKQQGSNLLWELEFSLKLILSVDLDF